MDAAVDIDKDIVSKKEMIVINDYKCPEDKYVILIQETA